MAIKSIFTVSVISIMEDIIIIYIIQVFILKIARINIQNSALRKKSF